MAIVRDGVVTTVTFILWSWLMSWCGWGPVPPALGGLAWFVFFHEIRHVRLIRDLRVRLDALPALPPAGPPPALPPSRTFGPSF